MKRRIGNVKHTSQNGYPVTSNTSVTWRKRSRDGFNLWIAFAGGIFISAVVWLALHGVGSSSSVAGAQFETQGSAQRSVQGSSAAELEKDQIDGSQSIEIKSNAHDATHSEQESASIREPSEPNVRIYLSESRSVETVPLETYVRGVVAAEMPLDFEPAALEAQALAARTYMVRRLWLNDKSGMPVSDADVTDTQSHQVYRSLAEMKHLRIDNEEGWRKVVDAVAKTAEEVIVYGDKPIEALFFSASNGYTENSEEVFPTKLPYLRSVASPWDKEGSPRARETVEMPLADFYAKLEVGTIASNSSPSENKPLRILEWTDGRRVKQMLAGSKKLTGEEARHKLGLRSAAFDWEVEKNKITITTFGSGHGVGMSQWGAEGMAKAGKTARQIVEHYYSGTRTEKVSKLAISTGKRL